MTRIALVCEDETHFRVVTRLIDRELEANVDWLRDILDDCRVWCGLDGERWHKYSTDDAYDLRPVTIGGKIIKPQGRIAGEPVRPEASMWRNVLLRLAQASPRADLVVLVRDRDGEPNRHLGLEQVRTKLEWPFPIIAAIPEPEIEAWIVSGFAPSNDERAALDQLRGELSFDPTLQSHRLTSHPNDSARDAKRVLTALHLDDHDSQYACLDRDRLRERGEHNGARDFLDEVVEQAVPVFTATH